MSWPSIPISRLLQGRYLLDRLETILAKVVWRLPAFLFYYNRFFILSYDFDTPASCSRRLKTIQIRPTGIDDLRALNRFLYKGDRYANRFKKGDIAMVAEQHDEIVGMVWLDISNPHYEEESEYCYPHPQKSAWTYDGYVLPDYQIKGVWTSIIDELVRHLRKISYHSLYCMIQGLNRHSINCHLRYGYRIRRHVVFMRVLFLRIYLEKNIDQTANNHAWHASFAFRRLRWYKGCLET